MFFIHLRWQNGITLQIHSRQLGKLLLFSKSDKENRLRGSCCCLFRKYKDHQQTAFTALDGFKISFSCVCMKATGYAVINSHAHPGSQTPAMHHFFFHFHRCNFPLLTCNFLFCWGFCILVILCASFNPRMITGITTLKPCLIITI